MATREWSSEVLASYFSTTSTTNWTRTTVGNVVNNFVNNKGLNGFDQVRIYWYMVDFKRIKKIRDNSYKDNIVTVILMWVNKIKLCFP